MVLKKLIDIWYMTVTDVEMNDEIWNDAQENDIDLDFSNKLPVIFIKKLMLIKEKKPKGFLLENVKGLVTHDRTNKND